MDWLPYSIAATVFLGISMSFYKMPSFKGYSSFFSTFWTNLFSVIFVLVGVFLVAGGWPSVAGISWYALAWGAFFAITMVLQKILLSRVESIAAYPVTSSLGSVVTVAIGLTILSESISPLQGLGIAIIILSTFLYTRKDGSFPLDARTISLCLGIVATSTASKYIQKLGAVSEPAVHFLFWQFIGATLFAFLIAYLFERKKFSEIAQISRYWQGSALIALFGVLGSYAIITALSLGPLSGVYAVHPAYTFVAGIFGYLLFKEKLTPWKLSLALLSVIGIIFLKIG